MIREKSYGGVSMFLFARKRSNHTPFTTRLMSVRAAERLASCLLGAKASSRMHPKDGLDAVMTAFHPWA